jgi:DNA-binding NarL/FixJ family response regulator
MLSMIIVDLELPDGSGLELLEELRPRFDRVSMLVLARRASDDFLDRAVRVEAAHVRKPYRPRELARFVDYALATTRFRRSIVHAVWTIDDLHRLSKRERDFLALRLAHFSNLEIAALWGDKLSTVETIARRLVQKTRSADMKALLRKAWDLAAAGGEPSRAEPSRAEPSKFRTNEESRASRREAEEPTPPLRG